MSQVDFFQTKLTVELSTFAAQSQAEQLYDVHQDPTNLIGKDYSTYLFPIFKWKALHRSGLEVLLLLYT